MTRRDYTATAARLERMIRAALDAGRTVSEVWRSDGRRIVAARGADGVAVALAHYGRCWTGAEDIARRMANRRAAGWTTLEVAP
jgi:hypothetical protein